MSKQTSFGLADLRAVVVGYIENETYEDATRLDSLIRSQEFILLKPLMLFTPSIGRATSKDPAICKMRDELQLDEDECSRYWLQAKNSKDVHKLGKLVRKTFGNDYDEIAREFYILECQVLLDSIYYLFRARRDELLNELKKRSIMIITNRLLVAGIASNLLDIVSQFASLLKDDNCPVEKTSLVERFIEEVAKCLFVIFYETQITPEEAKKLLLCIKDVSDIFGPYRGSRPLQQSWPRPVISTMLILQLTQIRALAQFIPLYHRHVNVAPFGQDILSEKEHICFSS